MRTRVWPLPLIAAALVAALVTGCGQKGPLYHPEAAPTPASTPAPAPATTPTPPAAPTR